MKRPVWLRLGGWTSLVLTGLVVLAASLLPAPPVRASDRVYYYSSDALHSEVVITDQNRNVVERTHYAPYGQVLDRSLRDGPGYTGHAEDPGTGLVYMQQRYYDPVAGRFLSADPVQADPRSGANFNRYWYANDNPYRYTDPGGRETGLALQAINKGVVYPQVPAGPAGKAIAGATLALVAAPVAIEAGLAALANPGTATTIVNAVADAVAGDAIGGTSLSIGAAGAATALSRAKEIQSTLSPRTQRAVTTAVAETAEGVRVVGSSEGALRPAQRAVMQPGEVAAKGARGTHAEVNAVNGARAQGLTPTSVSPSRPACSNCQRIMQEQRIDVKDREH